MNRRQQSIRGRSVGLGLELSRRVHYNEVGSAVRHLLPRRGDLAFLHAMFRRGQQQQQQPSPPTGTLKEFVSKVRFLTDTITPIAVAAAYCPRSRPKAQRVALAAAALAVSAAAAARWLRPLISAVEISDVAASER